MAKIYNFENKKLMKETDLDGGVPVNKNYLTESDKVSEEMNSSNNDIYTHGMETPGDRDYEV
jgi:hypothetical protein